jgi:hypothetical protein
MKRPNGGTAGPRFCREARAVLFTTEHVNQTFDDTDIDVVSLKTGKRTTVHHGGFFARYLNSGHLVWADWRGRIAFDGQ